MPHLVSFPRIEIPEVDLFTFLFERKDRQFPDSKELFTDGNTGRTYTFAQAKASALEFGKGLKSEWNWRRGDVLAFYTPNNIDTTVATFGLLWAGGIASPVNPLYTVEELTFQLTNSKAKAIITQKPFLKVVREAAKKAGIPEKRIILLGDEHDESGKFKHFTSVKSTAYCGQYAPTKVNPRKDLAFLVYSSGTTGMPKGVCLSHYNVISNLKQLYEVEGRSFSSSGGWDGKGDKQLGFLPFFHIYGLTVCIFQCAFNGWQLIVMPRFDIDKACQLIQDYKITYAYVPPPVVLALGKHPAVSKYDLTSIKLLNSGAAPLTHELTEAVWNRLKIPVKQGYGLSETSPVTHTQLPDEWAKFAGSVGKLVSNMEAKIVDENGKEVPEGEEGELWVKGPNVFLGYLDLPDKTKDTFSEDGYFKTGDIFKRDKYGNYYCVDRLKELIKYKGFQVAPAELEGILVSHEDIADACVIGVENHAEATEVPRAYIVLSPGQERTEAKAKEIAEWLAKQVAPYKKLRGGIKFIDEVPKSAAGKILRRVLRDQAKQEERKEGAKL